MSWLGAPYEGVDVADGGVDAFEGVAYGEVFGQLLAEPALVCGVEYLGAFVEVVAHTLRLVVDGAFLFFCKHWLDLSGLGS